MEKVCDLFSGQLSLFKKDHLPTLLLFRDSVLYKEIVVAEQEQNRSVTQSSIKSASFFWDPLEDKIRA